MKVIEPKWLREGGYIPKYQNPASPISNTWRGTWNLDAYNTSLELSYTNLFDRDDFDVDAYNNFLGRYYDIMRGSDYTPQEGNGTKNAIYFAGTHQYQLDFDKYGHHTDEFKKDWEHVTNANNADRFVDGLWVGGDEYVGAMTAQRRANYFNDSELARENEIAGRKGYKWELDPRAEGMSTENGRKYYRLIKNEVPPLIPPITPPGDTPRTDLDLDKRRYKDQEYTKQIPYKRQIDTSWLVPTANLISDTLTAGWNREEDLKKRFPLFEAPHRQAKVTNGYAARQQLQQLINNLLNQAQQQMGSNLNKNKEIIKTYNDYAQNAINLMALIRANEFARTTDLANQTSNWNNELGVQVRNLNNKSNAAAMNNIALANLKYNTAVNTSFQNNLASWYTGRTNFLALEAQNQAVHDYLNAQIDINNKKNKAYTDYLNLQDNPYSSKEYAAWKESFKNPSTSLEGVDLDLDGYIKESWFRDNWSTHESAAQYRNAWLKAIERAGMDFSRKNQELDNQLLAVKNSAPLYFIGSLVPYYNRWGNRKQLSSAYYAKEGMKVIRKNRDNSVRMAEYHRKWLRQENEKILKALKMSLEAMNKELDRLNKEQLVLLNAIFK